jgi:hypothetical protein
MDPITGLTALAGITLASMAGLRLKKKMEEGFAPLPDTNTQESQSRYNMFSGLVNPITNSIIPVGTSDTKAKETKLIVNDALGSYSAEFSPDNTQTLVLKQFKNQYPPRSDTQESLYGAMKFCRDAGKQTNPFTTYTSDGSVKLQGAVSPDGKWKFDEVCGVCLTSGIDEEGVRFRATQGMVVDPNAREAAVQEQETKGWSYPRAGPAIGSCEGAPSGPAFATNAKDLERFKSRQACLTSKTIGGPDACALCFESDNVYSAVPISTQTYPVYLVLQGTGTVNLKVKGTVVAMKTLSETSPVSLELKGAKEGDSFSVDVTSSDDSSANLYGYLQSKTPREGLYTMPLNLLVTIDDETGSSPSKSGGFYNFSDVGLDVAKIRPGSGKTRMRLRGSLPFTFVQPSEFAAMDCLDAPYQTRESSASAFSTDQPCYARGSGPGKYNDACLRQRILDAGCTNAGELYKNPGSLNSKEGVAQSISQIYTALQGIANQDMVDTEATKQCSGRSIQTPCDPFILRQGTLKFGDALRSTNATVASQATQCLSFLYHNKGASETTNPPRVGPTYTALTSYKNDQKLVKNLYCLPDGQLNPDTSSSGKETLVRIADTGYQGKVGVDAIKLYLSDQLALATNVNKNANSDPDRKAAIINCFGPTLSNLPAAATGTPTVIQNPCGILARFVRVLPSQRISASEAFIEISQLVVIDKTGTNVAPGKSTAGTTAALPSSSTYGSMDAGKAIDGQVYAKSANFYHSATPGGSAQFLLNLGSTTDVTKIIYITRGDSGGRLNYRKNGIRLQLLDGNQTVVSETLLNASPRQDISYLLPGADPSCKADLPTPGPVTFPTGYSAGVYLRFYDILDANPDIVPGNRGWGGRLGTPRAVTQVLLNDNNIGRFDRCGVVARGYYVAPGPETLYLYTESDDGIYVSFNNRQVIRNWTIHGPTGDASAPIQIPAAGIYPFELRFYEWGGGALCTLQYRINDEAEWKRDLSARFAYKPAEIQQEEADYQAKLLASQQRTPVLYGPWIPGSVNAQMTFTLNDGTKVYAIYDDTYTKMVSATNVARYYRGTFSQFNPNSWNSYPSAGNNYLLRFV